MARAGFQGQKGMVTGYMPLHFATLLPFPINPLLMLELEEINRVT